MEENFANDDLIVKAVVVVGATERKKIDSNNVGTGSATKPQKGRNFWELLTAAALDDLLRYCIG